MTCTPLFRMLESAHLYLELRLDDTPSESTTVSRLAFCASNAVARTHPSAYTPQMTTWPIPAIFRYSEKAGFEKALLFALEKYRASWTTILGSVLPPS